MTDITKYKNVSLSHNTYDLIDKIRKVIQPDAVLSRRSKLDVQRLARGVTWTEVLFQSLI